jgi:lysophospholipase L1-like esterase
MPAVFLRFTLVCVAFGCASQLPAADPFVFQDGDRVVLLGSTLIEREQKYGFWELALTLKNRDKNVTFRNLGWSGDTVHGEARNSFDESPKGFERLVTLTKELKPTVIVICYGHNESFEGKAGVPKFTAGLEKLLDSLAPTKARIVLMSPTPFEKAGPVADPIPKDKNLSQCRDVIKKMAAQRSLEFVDLFDRVLVAETTSPEPLRLTDNGIHYSPHGYAYTAPLLVSDSPDAADREKWFFLLDSPEADRLRTKIVEKNQLFFHRWRPQNETYLYLFRKHEQGKNAKEIPLFDPLIEKAEKEIAELKKALK